MTDEKSGFGDWPPGGGDSAGDRSEASDEATRVVSPTAAGGGAESAQVPDSAIPPGTVLINTYRVEELLARGGMGEIYRATHTELNTEHAIKVIRPELAGQPKIVDMFRREAASLRNVRNDAVIAYDGTFRDEEGKLYLVTEFVRGRPLSEVLNERRLSVEEVRRLRDRLAVGLGAAHEKGVVHRDVSPDNVILPDGQVENAKIIDFGIVKLTDASVATIIGEDFAGKYSYASPEQLGLFDGRVDARSDIYSLGLVLAAAAIGRPLDMGATPSAVIDARRSVPDLSEVPPELRAELAAMLEPNPDDRPQSLQELGRGEAGETGRPDLAGEELQSTSEEGLRADRLAVPPASRPTGDKALAKRRSRAGLSLMLFAALVVIGGATGGYLFLTDSGKDGQDSGQTGGKSGGGAAGDASEGLGALTAPPGGAGPVGPAESVTSTGPTAAEFQALGAQVRRLLDEFACADLSSSVSDRGFVEISGFLSTTADLERLTDGLAAFPNSQGSRVDVAVHKWPFCAAIATLREYTSVAPRSAGGPEIALNKSTGIYRDGDVFMVTVAGSDRYDGYLYVVYMNNEGDVAHLLPSPATPDNAARAGQPVNLGESGQYIIRQPFGRDMIIAIWTPVRLFETVPPQTQSAQEYFALMRQALSKVEDTGGTSATSGYVFITTRP